MTENSRIALVTGANQGIGLQIATDLAAGGLTVLLASRNLDRGKAAAQGIDGDVHPIQLDVTDEASTIAAFDAAEAAFGPVDSVVANAGVGAEKMALDLEMAEVDGLIAANLRGVFLTAREGARRMIAAGSREREHGRIIIIGSVTADKIYPYASVYGATKAAVRHLGRSLAREWARRGINVNIIQPGYFASEMTGDMFESAGGKALIASFPRQRIRLASDLHAPLLFLASDASAGVTGSVITVDDGQSL